MAWGAMGLRDALRKSDFTLYDGIGWVGPSGEIVTDSIVGDIEEGRISYVMGLDGKRIPLTLEMVLQKFRTPAEVVT